MNEKVERFVKELKRNLEDKYGAQIKKVILYGSQARGDATEESDIDILVVVKDDANLEDIDKYLAYLSVEYYVRDVELVNAFVIRESEYYTKHSDYLINIRQEGFSV
ncbi:MAG: nucleotidyltransferase domain-containing protein [Euryarchaeota archaeon]|nr:nucleotidyltransferase domain-containing protein [Euryarchaeota archaeon]